MWIITYRGKAATIEQINGAERYTSQGYETGSNDDEGKEYIVAATKKQAIRHYLNVFGFSWPERAEGLECQYLHKMLLPLERIKKRI